MQLPRGGARVERLLRTVHAAAQVLDERLGSRPGVLAREGEGDAGVEDDGVTDCSARPIEQVPGHLGGTSAADSEPADGTKDRRGLSFAVRIPSLRAERN